VDVAAQVQGAEAFCRRVQAGVADASFDQRRQLVELLIDRVVVTGDEVEIRYVVPTSPRGEHPAFVICVWTISTSQWRRMARPRAAASGGRLDA